MGCFYSVITLEISIRGEAIQNRKYARTLHYIRLSEHKQ